MQLSRETWNRLTLSVGDRIRLDSGEELLIGDVNELGGVCDDCHVGHERFGAEITHVFRIQNRDWEQIHERQEG